MGVSREQVSTSRYSASRKYLFSERGVTLVPFESTRLVFTQHRVNVQRVSDMLADMHRNGGDAPVCLVQFEGRHYVMNGHHRVVARHLAGFSGIEAYVLAL